MLSTTTPRLVRLTFVAILFSRTLQVVTWAGGKVLISQKVLYKLMEAPSTVPLKKPYTELLEYSMLSPSFQTHLSSISRERLETCTTSRN